MKNKSETWTSAPAPGVKCACSHDVYRAMKEALRAVDRDVEATGTASEDTINKVRAALALARK